MASPAEVIQSQLESLGYAVGKSDGPETGNDDQPRVEVITFEYVIEVGSQKGKTVTIGISPKDGNFPEVPPHWLHVSPPLDDGREGVTRQYQDAAGRDWLVMSRPPNDIWEELPVKHMSSYIKEHLGRMWSDL